jgi:biotin operon repressor
MNRTQYMEAVYSTDLDPASKAILVYYGFCKNWKDGTMAFPSASRVARATGLSIATVKRKVPELRAKGYLSDTGQRKGRGVIVYDLADPTSITVRPGSITVIPQKYHSDTAEVSPRYTEQVRDKKEEQVIEQESTSTDPDGPVDLSTSLNEIREDSPTPSNNKDSTTSSNKKEGRSADWLFLGRQEKAFFERQEANIAELNEAVRLYRFGNLKAASWSEKAEAACVAAGVLVEDPW